MDKPKIGLLGLTLEFYERGGPQIRESRERFVREKILPALADHAEVRFDGAVFTRETVAKTIADYEADGVDVLLVVLLTYSPSLVALPALQRTRLPIVIWNTQELHAVTEDYNEQQLIDNHGVHGTHDLCNVLRRAEVPFAYVTSHLDDAHALAELGEVVRAAYGVSRLRRARLGLLGYPFPGMGDFGLDTTHLTTTLGCEWEALSIDDYHRRVSQADATQVTQLTEAYKATYEIASDVTQDDLAATARAEIALRGLVRDHRLDAYSYQFLAFGDDDRTETVPFVAASRLLGEGVGFGGEGDLISAAHAALLNWINPPASFSEIFTIDFGGNAVLLSHMGEASAAMCRPGEKIRLLRRRKPLVPVRVSQLVLAGVFQPGEATLTALTLTAGHQWRIIASPVTIEDFGPCPNAEVPHAKVRPMGNVRDFLTAYAKAGGPHHLAICLNDACELLAVVAELLNADYVEI